MAIRNIHVPSLGETTEEATFSKWLVQNKSYVTIDQVICVISTDKVDAELTAEYTGVLIQKANKGDVVKTGALIASIDTEMTVAESNLTEEQKESIATSLSALISESPIENSILNNIDDGLRQNLSEYYSSIIELLTNTIENQIKIINTQKIEIQNYKSQFEKILALKVDLRNKLDIDFETEKIDNLSEIILEHFKKIEFFDLYIKNKKSLLENWMSMIGKGMTTETISEIIQYSKENNHKRILTEITSISNSWNSLKKKENNGIVDFEYSDKVRNKITLALISLLYEFEEHIS